MAYPNYNNRYRKNNYNSYSKPRKKSGCKMTRPRGKNGEQFDCISGWNKSKARGFISFVASPRIEGGSGTKNKDIEQWTVKVQFPDGKKLFTGFYNLVTRKLTIPDLQMVANPAKNYFGSFIRRK